MEPSEKCEWLFCFTEAQVEMLYPTGDRHVFCLSHAEDAAKEPALMDGVLMPLY